MRYAAIAAALLLTACQAPNLTNDQLVPVSWTRQPVDREYHYLAQEVSSRCFDTRAVALRDRTGCVVTGRYRCRYITLPADDHALNELNAVCNGFRWGQVW